MPTHQVQPDARSALPPGSLQPERIVATLREAIVVGDLVPGTRLTEARIARHLGASRTPVREALVQLEREGLVTIVARAGAYVRTVTRKDIEETYQVRIALEVYATRLLTGRLGELGKAQLREILGAMRAAAESADVSAYADELDRFYDALLTLAGNATLHAVHDSVLGPIRRLRRIALSQTGRMTESLGHAADIAAAIVAGDTSAEQHMIEQLTSACESVKRALEHHAI